jgi:alkylation response protein AidB-like acyl-CoA dehydrogenase
MAASLDSARLHRRTDWAALTTELGPEFASRAATHDAGDSFVAQNYAALKANKFFSAGVPAEFGGGDAQLPELAAMLRRLAGYCGSTALALAMHTHQVAIATWRWRNQKAPVEGLLKKVVADELVIVSSGGSDWLPGSGKAEKVEGGYRITGRKIFGSGSPAGGLLMTCAVYEDPEAGPTVLHFPAPMTSKGIEVLDNWRALGMRGTASGDIALDGLFVADAAISGRRPAGKWHPLFHIIAMVAFPLIYSVYVGLAEAGRAMALEAAKKKPADPSTAYLVGEMDNELTSAQLAVDDMVALAARAQPGPETTNAIMIRRTLAGQAAIRTIEKAMEVAGGQAFQRGFGLERLFRDVQAARYHPLQQKPQQRYTGRLALGLDLDG